MITDPLAVLVVLALVVLLAVQLERHVQPFRSLGAGLVGILIGMVLSNTGLIPGESETYVFLVGPGLQVGIALILLRVDVGSVLQAGPSMLAAFGIGALGTAIGASLAGFLLSGVIGPETWKLAGQFTGTYVGGGVNFAALGQTLGTSSDLFTAALAADVIVTAVWMAACLTVPVVLGVGVSRHAPVDPTEPTGERPATLEADLHSSGKPMTLTDAATLVCIALAGVWISARLAAAVPAVPQMLWLTTLVLLAAQIPAVKRVSGGALWGNYFVLLFLASNGARSVVANIIGMGPAVLYFALITVAVHGLVLFGLGRVVRIDLPTLAVASQANVGGAGSAMALAGARGYGAQLVPGVAVGLLGYAAGNYLGLAVAGVLSAVL